MSKILIANWKNCLPKNLKSYIKNLLPNVMISPPTSHLFAMETRTVIAQDIGEEGVLTGSVSASLIKSLGVFSSIVGHPERRIKLNESRGSVYKKIKVLLENNMGAVICTDDQFFKDDIKFLESIREDLPNVNGKDIIFAYEPSEFIGSNRKIDPKVLDSKIKYMRKYTDIPIIYGGNVNSNNCRDMLDYVDGFLIGRASLDIDEINKIAKSSL